VHLERFPIELCPLLNQAQCVPRRDVPDDLVTVDVELAFLSLMFRMEVLRFVFPKVHPDHDAEEDRDDGYVREYIGRDHHPHAHGQSRHRVEAGLQTRLQSKVVLPSEFQ
jgi:hypothetical protein